MGLASIAVGVAELVASYPSASALPAAAGCVSYILNIAS